MGLATYKDGYKILTDIQGVEDHLGDMDFKVAGTRKGITAFQLDIKLTGISAQILKEALEQAKKARFFILDKIDATISNPAEISDFAPKFKMMEVILYLYQKSRELVARGMPMSVLKAEGIFEKVIAIKYDVPNDNLQLLDLYRKQIDDFYDAVLEKNA